MTLNWWTTLAALPLFALFLIVLDKPKIDHWAVRIVWAGGFALCLGLVVGVATWTALH